MMKLASRRWISNWFLTPRLPRRAYLGNRSKKKQQKQKKEEEETEVMVQERRVSNPHPSGASMTSRLPAVSLPFPDVASIVRLTGVAARVYEDNLFQSDCCLVMGPWGTDGNLCLPHSARRLV